MNQLILTGTVVVNLALAAYSIAIISEQRKRIISNKIIIFLTVGVILDIAATSFMIAGSTHSFMSSHGILGYSSLTAMLIDCVLLWKFRLDNGKMKPVSKKIHIYSRIAYIWWITAYITGALIVALRHLNH